MQAMGRYLDGAEFFNAWDGVSRGPVIKPPTAADYKRWAKQQQKVGGYVPVTFYDGRCDYKRLAIRAARESKAVVPKQGVAA